MSTDHLDRALAAVLDDLRATGAPLPRVEASDWQQAPGAESAMLRSARDGSGQGVWVDSRAGAIEQVVMLAEQVQEWAIEELGALGRPTNWPPCGEHPARHPLAPVNDDGTAVWACPRSGRPACRIGEVSGSVATRISVVAVDERDSGWEVDRPRYRVYLQGGSRGAESTGGATWSYDITGADVLQVVDWAQRHAGDARTYAVALVVDDAEQERRNPGYGRGLVWLVGMDGNDSVEPGSPEEVVQQRMVRRRDDPVRLGEADRAP